MIIACLGWGSLIWRPEALPIRRQWHTDGPLIRVEFARQSSDGRVTLVLHDKVSPVRGLWALMTVDDLANARTELAKREGIPDRNVKKHTKQWCRSKVDGIPPTILSLDTWAECRGVDAVIWTALPPKFDNQESSPSSEQVVNYLSGLHGRIRDHAEEYIRRAPRQIDTACRRHIEAALGWCPT